MRATLPVPARAAHVTVRTSAAAPAAACAPVPATPRATPCAPPCWTVLREWAPWGLVAGEQVVVDPDLHAVGHDGVRRPLPPNYGGVVALWDAGYLALADGGDGARRAPQSSAVRSRAPLTLVA